MVKVIFLLFPLILIGCGSDDDTNSPTVQVCNGTGGPVYHAYVGTTEVTPTTLDHTAETGFFEFSAGSIDIAFDETNDSVLNYDYEYTHQELENKKNYTIHIQSSCSTLYENSDTSAACYPSSIRAGSLGTHLTLIETNCS